MDQSKDVDYCMPDPLRGERLDKLERAAGLCGASLDGCRQRSFSVSWQEHLL